MSKEETARGQNGDLYVPDYGIPFMLFTIDRGNRLSALSEGKIKYAEARIGEILIEEGVADKVRNIKSSRDCVSLEYFYRGDYHIEVYTIKDGHFDLKTSIIKRGEKLKMHPLFGAYPKLAPFTERLERDRILAKSKTRKNQDTFKVYDVLLKETLYLVRMELVNLTTIGISTVRLLRERGEKRLIDFRYLINGSSMEEVKEALVNSKITGYGKMAVALGESGNYIVDRELSGLGTTLNIGKLTHGITVENGDDIYSIMEISTFNSNYPKELDIFNDLLSGQFIWRKIK